MKNRLSLALLVVAFLAVTGAHNVLHPIWEAPEEPHHYAFIRYLVEHHSLPQPEEHVTGRTGGENETYQTPLYYLIQSLLVGWTDDGTAAAWHRNPYATWPDYPARYAVAVHRQEEAFPYQGYVLGVHLARLVSSLMGAGTVVVTYFLARRLGSRHWLALAAAALAAFTPGFAFLSAAVNNDDGVTLASALVLLHCLSLLGRDRVTWRDGALSGVLVAIATLMKLNGLETGIAVVATWGILLWRAGRPALRRLLGVAAPMPLAFAALTFWWPLAIWERLPIVLFSSAIAPEGPGQAPPAGGFSPASVGSTLNRLFLTYWGAFGWTNEILLPDWVYTLLLVMLVAAALGWLLYASGRLRGNDGEYQGAGLAVLALYAVASLVIVVVRYEQMPLAGVWDGRFLYPALPAFSVLLALGLAEVARRRALAPAIPAVGLAALTLSVPLTKSQTAFPPPVMAWGIFDEARVPQQLGLTYENGITLLGLDTVASSVQPGDNLAVVAYWRSEVDQQGDSRPIFRAVDPNGETVVSDHSLPQEGVFPPSLWQRGEVVLDSRRLALPATAVPGLYTLQMRVVRPPSELGVALRAGGDPQREWQDVATFRVRPPTGQGPAVPLAEQPSFGGQLALTGYTLAGKGQADGQLDVTLFWRALKPVTADYHISVQLLDDAGKLVAQHDGVPYEGRYPVPRWEVGEVVPDKHDLSLAGVPVGTHRLLVVVYDPASGTRLRLPGGADFLELTRVTP